MTNFNLTVRLEKDEDYNQTYSEHNDWKNVKTTFLDLSVDQFYDEFLAENAPFNFHKFSEIQNHTEINVKPWNKNQLTVNCVVPLVNVPFIKKSNFVKTVVIKKMVTNQLLQPRMLRKVKLLVIMCLGEISEKVPSERLWLVLIA